MKRSKSQILKLAEKFAKADHCKSSFFRGYREAQIECENVERERDLYRHFLIEVAAGKHDRSTIINFAAENLVQGDSIAKEEK